uniref:NAD(P)(+)--arginine ADP-ribosyltransferase n=1 Tax=Eutreptiella gymnastica TaxID=73025 RepID=A0A7S4GGF7_9EUGL
MSPFSPCKAPRGWYYGQLPGSKLNLWGFGSFSMDDKVINSEFFSGKPPGDAIIFHCGELTGVDLEAFNPGLASQEEILPLAPAIFRVLTATKYGHKVFVAIEQLSHAEHAYVLPRQ